MLVLILGGTMCIGKLESVDVRKLWAHEQYDFSAWLAKEENLSLLGEALGISFADVDNKINLERKDNNEKKNRMC